MGSSKPPDSRLYIGFVWLLGQPLCVRTAPRIYLHLRCHARDSARRRRQGCRCTMCACRRDGLAWRMHGAPSGCLSYQAVGGHRNRAITDFFGTGSPVSEVHTDLAAQGWGALEECLYSSSLVADELCERRAWRRHEGQPMLWSQLVFMVTSCSQISGIG